MTDLFFILDGAGDFDALARTNDLCDGTLVTISAPAFAGVPSNWPTERLLLLDQLVNQDKIETEIAAERPRLMARFFADSCCPYYKVKQIIDVCLEKQALINALSLLPGRKIYIGQRGSWASVDGDLSEELRIAAMIMEGHAGFECDHVEPMARLKAETRSLARNLVRALNSLRRARQADGAILVDISYGSGGDFPAGSARYGDLGALTASCSRGFRLAEVWALLRFDRPVLVPAKATGASLAEALVEVILTRSRRVHEIAVAVAERDGWSRAPYLFTVKHGGIADYAAVRAARRVGVPVVTMQHAVVGHDEWTASQYVDALESDVKLVAAPAVARELAAFERGRCSYVATSIPHFRKRSPHLGDWSNNTLTYVLTGFTRTNTMYDQRRLNDAIYLGAVRRNLAALSPFFQIRLKPHPYNVAKFGMAIERRLSEEFGVSVEDATLDRFPGAVVIDSPTTILGDAIRLGKWVFVINETAVLREPFASQAAELAILFDSAEALTQAVTRQDRAALRKCQSTFRDFFLATYLTGPDRKLPEAIAEWLATNRQLIRPPLRDDAASAQSSAHLPERDARARGA
jgi:hypothetical protein